MNATVYILGILLQAAAGIICFVQVRNAPRKLPWLLIAVSAPLSPCTFSATRTQMGKP